ncbi:predicted protein [Sclerotinia sclerotiorum 1980 UF-70]|uniref:Uncharacterized protein n=1 Tax=Sclerotinia sclerotiorum (strain ATCC 18683 / 1980 / Ss-1) TaxID=665079 RepID=A7F836_SCLS1|nr:predicted protein [Sclerotinia sclerotiorum 1980 UF-70]EDN98907.1 predicted protein [Sclerotinia sclerotiorum 1980 UF-70]
MVELECFSHLRSYTTKPPSGGIQTALSSHLLCKISRKIQYTVNCLPGLAESFLKPRTLQASAIILRVTLCRPVRSAHSQVTLSHGTCKSQSKVSLDMQAERQNGRPEPYFVVFSTMIVCLAMSTYSYTPLLFHTAALLRCQELLSWLVPQTFFARYQGFLQEVMLAWHVGTYLFVNGQLHFQIMKT